MGNFIAFAKRQGWPVAVILFGVVMWSYGVATTAYDLWTAGLPPWGVQLIGGLLVFAALGSVLYRMDAVAHAPRPTPTPTRPVAEPLSEGLKEFVGGGRVTPNRSLHLAVEDIRKSSWGREHKADLAAATRDLLDKLSLGRLDVWGSSEPEGRVIKIPQAVWGAYGLDPSTNTVTMSGEPVFHRAQLAASQVYRIWPG